MFVDLSFLLIFLEPWFWQGLIVNASFSIFTIPFTNNLFYKVFKNRKKNRIKNAFDEMKIYCLQHLIKEKHINKNDFDNHLYIVANKYKLDIKDIYNDKNTFWQNLIHSIIEIDLIDDSTKERIANKIRKNKMFAKSDNENSKVYNSILTEEREYSNEYNNLEDIQLNKKEKYEIYKYIGITTGIIFIFLLLYTFLCHVLIQAYGINSLIFVNTIIIIIASIPILVNGIINFTKFNEHNKIYFAFLLIILLFNAINFICVVGILLYKN